jgi:hypothetical protein
MPALSLMTEVQELPTFCCAAAWFQKDPESRSQEYRQAIITLLRFHVVAIFPKESINPSLMFYLRLFQNYYIHGQQASLEYVSSENPIF